MGGGARTGDDRGEDRAQFADPHPPQEGRADDEDRRDGVTTVRVLPRTRYVVVLLGRRRSVGRVGAVLQPAVAVRRERYRGGDGDLEAVGQVAHHPVQVGSRLLRDRDGRAHGRTGPGDDQGDPGGGEQHEDGDRRQEPAGGVPAGTDETAGESPREKDHGDGRGQQGDGQRAAADAQHDECPCPRDLRACFHTHSGHDRPHPLPVDLTLSLHTPPLWHPPLTSQCRWAKCRNACAAP